jgi:hypothetical protein
VVKTQVEILNIMKYLLKCIKVWWRANMSDYPYWRVTYKDGKRTHLLYWHEANGLKNVFNGKMSIDYSVPL